MEGMVEWKTRRHVDCLFRDYEWERIMVKEGMRKAIEIGGFEKSRDESS